MTEALTPPPEEFQPVPYDKIASYVPEGEQMRGRMYSIALRAGDRTAIIRRGLREADVSWIDGTEPLEILLRTPGHGRIISIASYLGAYLNLATMGDRKGARQFHYASLRFSAEEFNRRFPAEHAEVLADSRLNTIYLVLLERRRGEQERFDPILYLRPGGIEQYQGRDSFNPLVFYFIDKHPAIAQFVARFALLGFPSPPLTSQV